MTAVGSSAPSSKASRTVSATRSSFCAGSASTRSSGVRPAAARAAGCGSRSWPRYSGVPLELTEVEEGSAYGAALLAGVANGVFASAEEAVAACVRVRDRVEPNEAWSGVYDEGYARYRALYPAVKSLEER